MISLKTTVVAAICCAVLSCAIPFTFRDAMLADSFSFSLSAGWLILISYGFLKYRLRGSWGLLGLPLAVFWPALSGMIYYACRFNHDCI